MQEKQNSLIENSGDGDDPNHPKKSVERPHKLPINKRKRKNNQQEVEEVIPDEEFLLEDMELDANIEDIEFPDDEQRVQQSREVAVELVTQEPVFYEEESLTLHSALFDKDLKKLVFERVNSKGKRIQEKDTELDLNGVPHREFPEFIKLLGDTLEVSVDEMEAKNARLKERIKELECALMPPPIFLSPIATIQPGRNPNGTPESSLKLKGTSSLLVAVRRFVGENIKKRMSLILEAWDVGNNIISFGSKLNNLREYLQDDFNNEEGFYKDVVITFILKVSGMTELKRKEEDLPSPTSNKTIESLLDKKDKSVERNIG
jgi:hypothetical protein